MQAPRLEHIAIALFISLMFGCSATPGLITRALEATEKAPDNASDKLMLTNHFESTLPIELNADYHAILKAPGFTQRPWSISDPKARRWCVQATQQAQKTKGETDPDSGEGKITVTAVKSRCSPLIEAHVNIEHTCVTVEEAKKHFTKCTVEGKLSLTRYVVDLDAEMNFGYLKDGKFGEQGKKDFTSSLTETRNITNSEEAAAITRNLLEAVSAEVAVAINAQIDDAEALSR